ncbi:LacI family DNA-binding transcriptional regulator [Algicella marina]|uniref:LacI family DNA-binding transcriptional regulator n=1 Tax=Algicella marina TaxID=2683284 RepID=A0A6P1T2S2_9RHOB|nr:LacI family DNA-binding transcriptional regulator [Algicella marina]QHQ36031.1 LacI family DNA-binding transcriptional regulator [Algicella marina]
MTKRPRSTGRTTIADVAARAGVSAITVSRALRTPDRVQAATRARVEEAIRELDYLPDAAASTLASRNSNVVGVILPSVTNKVFLGTLRGIYDVAEEGGLQVQISNSRYSQDEEERLLRIFLSQRPAGLIVTGIDQSEATRKLLRSAPCPVVQITETGPDPLDMMVGFDHAAAGALAARHLAEQGYRRIGFLGARQDPRSVRRQSGFRDSLEQLGLFDPARVLFSPDQSSVGLGSRQLLDLLRVDPKADAVLCNNDDLALGALFACQRQGLDVPNRFGICGFNDVEFMAFTSPSLTSVRTPRRQIGIRAMRLIMARIDDPAAVFAPEHLAVELSQRRSTGRDEDATSTPG